MRISDKSSIFVVQYERYMIDSPILILLLVFAIIFLVPVLCRKVHIPSIVGFILFGMLVGPDGLGMLGNSPAIRAVGQMGMLYIMFQSGVEIDINDFRQHRIKSILFGLYSFLCPFLLGIVTGRLLGLEWGTTLLLAGMYGSHTLMTYPTVSRYGIQKSQAVNITVGGTMLAISFSLLVLACVKSTFSNGMHWWMILLIPVSLFVILWGVPKILRWRYKQSQDPIENFVLAMLALVFSAWLTEMAGLDGILGAFVCGVALNGLIPSRSPMMDRINFIGNSIFVPLFLISVGMLIDVRVFWSSWGIIGMAAVMILTKLAGKWTASWLAEKTFHLSSLERQLIFGLSHATAAGTLAIVTIGYQMGLFSSEILNSAIIMILVLCTISSFVTEHAAKELALQTDDHLQSERTKDDWVMLSVGEELREQLKMLSNLSGLHESDITTARDWQEASNMIEHDSRSAIIYHEKQPLNTLDRILVAVPKYAEKEYDFISCFGQIRRLSSQVGAKVVFFATDDTKRALKQLCQREGKSLAASYREMDDWEDVLSMAKEADRNDLIVLISSRRSTTSYNPLFEQIPYMLEHFFEQYSYMILYPEQGVGGNIPDALLSDVPQTSRVWRIVGRIKQSIMQVLLRIQTRE